MSKKSEFRKFRIGFLAVAMLSMVANIEVAATFACLNEALWNTMEIETDLLEDHMSDTQKWRENVGDIFNEGVRLPQGEGGRGGQLNQLVQLLNSGRNRSNAPEIEMGVIKGILSGTMTSVRPGEIEGIQRRLREMGYTNVEVDGVVRQSTREALSRLYESAQSTSPEEAEAYDPTGDRHQRQSSRNEPVRHGRSEGVRSSPAEPVRRSFFPEPEGNDGGSEIVSAHDTSVENPTTKKAQEHLNTLGEFGNLDVDGYHGPLTSQAVKDWQSQEGYEPTGELTREQFDILESSARLRESSGSESEEAYNSLLD